MRGYFAIGTEDMSKPRNLGNLIRSAHAFGASYFLLSAMLRQRPRLVHACVPLLLSSVRSLTLALFHAAPTPTSAPHAPRPQLVADSYSSPSYYSSSPSSPPPPPSIECARHLRRLLEAISLHKKVLVRHGSYLLADIVAACRERPLPSAAHRELLPGIHALLGMCTEVEVQAVHAASSGDGGKQRVLKELLESYERTFKYRGKA